VAPPAVSRQDQIVLVPYGLRPWATSWKLGCGR